MIPLPPRAPGMRIGLQGGSFDPAHEGHRHVSRTALRRLRLDRVWWLVTPGNPLKAPGGIAPARERLEAAREVAADPRIVLTDFEEAAGTRYTVDSLAWLLPRAGGAHFVWIMGADSLADFDRWRGWRDIAAMVPIVVVDRPGFTFAALNGPAARALGRYRVPESEAPRVGQATLPAWVLLTGPRSPLSSTAIRAGEAPA